MSLFEDFGIGNWLVLCFLMFLFGGFLGWGVTPGCVYDCPDSECNVSEEVILKFCEPKPCMPCRPYPLCGCTLKFESDKAWCEVVE